MSRRATHLATRLATHLATHLATRLATALVWAPLLLASAPVQANPLDYFGFGARGPGMGNAQVALADDFSANYYNPAGLATRDALQLQLGYTYVDLALALNGYDLGVDGVRGFQGGLVVPGDVWGHRLAVSLGLYMPDERITRLRALPEAQPRFALYDNHPQRIVLTTSVAFELLVDTLYVGLGLTYLSDTKGQLDVTGVVDLRDAGGTTLQTAVDVDFVAARYPSAGIVWKPNDNLRIGLAYREEFDLTLDIGVVVNGDIVLNGASDSPTTLVPNARLEVASKNSNLFAPRQLTLGVAWSKMQEDQAHPCWTLTAELGWYQWSRFKTPTAFLTTSLDAGTLPLSIPENPVPLSPDFSDILVPRLGGEVFLYNSENFDLQARAGIYWEPTPAPSQRGDTNFVDGDKFGFGLGLTLGFKDLGALLARPFYLDLAATFVTMPERSHTKLDPADPTGSYVSSGSFFGFATSLRLDFGGEEAP